MRPPQVLTSLYEPAAWKVLLGLADVVLPQMAPSWGSMSPAITGDRWANRYYIITSDGEAAWCVPRITFDSWAEGLLISDGRRPSSELRIISDL